MPQELPAAQYFKDQGAPHRLQEVVRSGHAAQREGAAEEAVVFYQTIIAAVLFYTVMCWGGGSTSRRDTSKMMRRAGSVVGMNLDSVVTETEKRPVDKVLDIMDDVSLHTVISLFSDRSKAPRWTGPYRTMERTSHVRLD